MLYRTVFTSLWMCPSIDTEVQKIIKKGHSPAPTTGHQFDVPPVDDPFLVAGLTANCDVLKLVEGHLAPHLAGLMSLTEADIGLDAQHLWL